MGVVKWVVWGLLMGLVLLVVSNCTMLGLNYASLSTDGKPAPVPQITATTEPEWVAQRPGLKAAFEANVYGPWPAGTPVSVISRRVADPAYKDGLATLEELEVAVGGNTFRLGLATPNIGETPFPLIIAQTFSDNCFVFASMAMHQSTGAPCERTNVPGLISYIFGEHIAHPPMEDILGAGFAYASFHASDLVRDDPATAPADLASFASEGGVAPTGAIAAWAYGYTAAIVALSNDAAIDLSRIAAFGHSRHGKSALLAGVWEPRIGAVVAHQSGYGGAALSRSTTGEGLEQMVAGASVAPFLSIPGYPHWFDPAYATYAGRLDDIPIDQHQLLALIAPTPVFLGNARRDVWSDPNSTFRAAQSASNVYALYGLSGLAASGMQDFRPGDTIAYFLRSGGHGTTAEDMTAMLAFLSAHFLRLDTGERIDAALD